MRVFEFLIEGRSSLYHAIGLDHAVQALKEDALGGRTTQRYWPDGLRRKDDDPEYNDSFWMKGISLTRDKNYANNWNSIVFELNQNLLRNNYSIKPLSWNYLISQLKNANHKKEKEEFLITKKTGSKQFKIDTVEGYVKPLSKFLLNITMDKESFKLYGEKNKNAQYIINHPKFLGFFKGI